jgi:PAS domain S-box-containing protein
VISFILIVMKLSIKIFLLIITLSALILIIVEGYIYSNLHLNLSKSVSKEQLETVQEVMDEIDNVLSERVVDINEMAFDAGLSQYFRPIVLPPEATQSAQANRYFNGILKVNSAWEYVYFVDLNGTIGVTSDALYAGKQIVQYPNENNAYIKAVTGVTYYSDVEAYQKGNPSMIFASPVYYIDHEQKQLKGIVIGRINWEIINQIISNIDIYSANLYTHKGLLISTNESNRKNKILQINDSLSQELSRAKNGTDNDSLIYKTPQNYNELASYVTEKGNTRYPGLGWYLVFEQKTTDAFREINRLIITVVIISSVMILILIIIILWYLHRIVINPINYLTNMAQTISNGNFDMKLSIYSHDEMEVLANTFNKMSVNLKKLYTNLDGEVREKTAEIDRKLQLISNQKESLEKTAIELSKFRLAVDNAPIHIVMTDNRGNIIYANSETQKTTGYPITEIINHNPSLWGKQMDPEFYKRMWHTLINEKRTFNGEMTNRRKDGSIYQAKVSISPILNQQFEVIFFVGIEQDISQEKEVDRMKTEFISLTSHQLRTPITTIRWELDMLRDERNGKLSQIQTEYVQKATAANLQMNDLISTLLDISRIESGKIDVNREITDVTSYVNGIIEDFKPKLSEKAQSIIVIIEPSIGEILLDRRLMRQVFVNILSNSIKYSPVNGEIKLNIGKKNNMIIVNISDSGIGIPKTEQNRIFSRFFRASNAYRIESDGNGLGLYFVKSIINTLKGDIWFESKENEGTIFTFSLPNEQL